MTLDPTNILVFVDPKKKKRGYPGHPTLMQVPWEVIYNIPDAH